MSWRFFRVRFLLAYASKSLSRKRAFVRLINPLFHSSTKFGADAGVVEEKFETTFSCGGMQLVGIRRFYVVTIHEHAFLVVYIDEY
jgi:hypothetical protein